jgi:hypothetical protein
MSQIRLNNQTVGNVGLYFVCYQLSRRGWNVMPTARNARGVDILAYSDDASRTLSFQVKALSKKYPVPLGPSTERLMGDYFVVCCNLGSQPECFILRPADVKALAHRGEKEGRVSFWLQPKVYAVDQYREAWDQLESAPTAVDHGGGNDPSASVLSQR